MDLPFSDLPIPPASASAGSVLARLVQGIGFRYRWATEGLAAEDTRFRPAGGSMDLGELLTHIHGLLRWTARSVGIDPGNPGMADASGLDARLPTLELARALAERLVAMSEEDLGSVAVRTARGETYPFWNLVNGPLADSLTHIGQVASWRRILGKPHPSVDVFRGRSG